MSGTQGNSGNWNSGDWNSGNWNSGNWNSGDWNSGNRNSGDWNSGNWNSGNRNSGNRNSGNWNSGNWNSGDWNSGNRNSGDWNSGNRNSGDWNSGNWNSGYFCTETPSPTFFDKPTDLTWDEADELVPWVDLPCGCDWVASEAMTDDEKADHPNHTTIGGYLKVIEKPLSESFPVAWQTLDTETKQRFKDLPNFDADKFLTITGVDVRAEEKPVPQEVIVDGHKYVLAAT